MGDFADDEPPTGDSIEKFLDGNERDRVCRTLYYVTDDHLDDLEDDVAHIIREKAEEKGMSPEDLDGDPSVVANVLMGNGRNAVERMIDDDNEFSDKIDGRGPEDHFRELLDEMAERGQRAHQNVGVTLGMVSTHGYYNELVNEVLSDRYNES